VKEMKSDIICESKVNQGTKFTIPALKFKLAEKEDVKKKIIK